MSQEVTHRPAHFDGPERCRKPRKRDRRRRASGSSVVPAATIPSLELAQQSISHTLGESPTRSLSQIDHRAPRNPPLLKTRHQIHLKNIPQEFNIPALLSRQPLGATIADMQAPVPQVAQDCRAEHCDADAYTALEKSELHDRVENKEMRLAFTVPA
jgi:hypothetical protein